jgi:hypothetical protein
MNDLHMPSILKSGGAAAGLSALLLLLSFIPGLGDIVGFCFLCGGFLIPIAAGLGYGYLAPGKEETTQSAIGGALAGGASGFLLGIFFGINALVSGAVTEGLGLGEALAGGTVVTLLCVCGLGIAGLIFGAIGGVIWPLIQGSD